MLKKKSSLLRLFPYGILILVILWGAGFIAFRVAIDQVTNLDSIARANNAGIVALTGGNDRLETGVALLQKGVGERLLISGVHASVTPDDMSRRLMIDATTLECCIDVDHVSSNTIDNAKTSADWVRAHNFRALYLVTSAYHIPRSWRLIEAETDSLRIIPVYVKDERTWPVIVVEYNKYIYTLALTLLQ